MCLNSMVYEIFDKLPNVTNMINFYAKNFIIKTLRSAHERPLKITKFDPNIACCAII